jgi:hypothetical protein
MGDPLIEACMAITNNGRNDLAVGAVNSTMELGYGQRMFFNWTGSTKATRIELSHDGDDAILKARPEMISPTAC